MQACDIVLSISPYLYHSILKLQRARPCVANATNFQLFMDLPDEPDGGFYEVLLGRARADAMEPFPKIIEQGGIISGVQIVLLLQ